MYVSTGHMDMTKRGRSMLGVDRRRCRSSKRVDCDILTEGFNRIERILIPPRYTFFSGSPTIKNSRVERACPKQFQDG
jgi:hypothetical protein